jgi:CPA1 family monovalent cation:H+ antiporter
MLAFLLFAGALNLNGKPHHRGRDRRADERKGRHRPSPLSQGVKVEVERAGEQQEGQHALSWALVFGALISPTDPVAVLATLKNVQVPQALEVVDGAHGPVGDIAGD